MKKTNPLFCSKVLLIVILVISLSCNSSTSKKSENTVEKNEESSFFTIPFSDIIKNQKEIKLSEFADSVELIQFENTPKALLGYVHEIQLTKDYIFIIHSGNKLITQFDRRGKYIRHIGKLGRGPKEYALCRIFSVDEENERIYIQTNWTRKILVYNFDGEYIRTIANRAVARMYNVWRRDSFFVSFEEPQTGNEPFIFIEHNEHGDTLQTVANHIFWGKDEASHFMVNFHGQNCFYRFGNKLHMKGWYNDTVYTFNAENKIVPQYFIDLKEHKIPDDLVYERKSTRPMPTDACWTGVHETSNYIFIPYSYHYNMQAGKVIKEDQGCVLYNKKARTGAAIEEAEDAGFINDITGGPYFMPTETNDTLAMMAVSALDMKLYLDSNQFKDQKVKSPAQKEKLKQLRKTLNEEENSFLFLVRIKR